LPCQSLFNCGRVDWPRITGCNLLNEKRCRAQCSAAARMRCARSARSTILFH
jgi:hypothetical protein